MFLEERGRHGYIIIMENPGLRMSYVLPNDNRFYDIPTISGLKSMY